MLNELFFNRPFEARRFVEFRENARCRCRGVPPARAAAFGTSWLVLIAALTGPLDGLGNLIDRCAAVGRPDATRTHRLTVDSEKLKTSRCSTVAVFTGVPSHQDQGGLVASTRI